MLTVDCHFPELGNPRASFSGFYEFPIDSQYKANPGFIFAMGNSLLTFIIAIFSNIELFLIHKKSGAILSPANYGLDGHVISDFTVFKDTAFISSQTG
ncbi:MAG: hypothetical protein KDD99_13090, partial [Bacteroidetes bacterium]|nr:hypothetical protein [Bacteroidota bacterium]